MSLAPKGISIQALYREYRDNKITVNRKYQRKLVWSVEEKQQLIDTVLKGYPIPLFLLGEKKDDKGDAYYEIIDGMQRLNAIMSFIENEFSFNNQYFDINELSRAKNLAEEGIIIPANNSQIRLSPKECANFLDYQLAVTVYPALSENNTTEVFNRINSGGKQLSNQDRRQAGVISKFGDFIRNISSEIRGDVSKEILNLTEMPSISISSTKSKLKYGLNSDETFWCQQGILWANNLRESEDEELLADIVVSILSDKPFNRSREKLDELYEESELQKDIENRLIAYNPDKLRNEIIDIFSIIKNILETTSDEKFHFRNIVMGASKNPAKQSFYTVFMAFYNIIVKEGKSPENFPMIVRKLYGLQSKIKPSSHFVTSEDRTDNINITRSLIQTYFIKKEPSILGHGPSLTIDFENSLRRSRTESSRYELKQGILKLDDRREVDSNILSKIVNTICAIANLGSHSQGYIILGVADKESDSTRIKNLDKVPAFEISEKFVVGIDRECKILGIKIDDYIKRIIDYIRKSNLTEPLKTQTISTFDSIVYKSATVLRIRIPSQSELSYVGDKLYMRQDSNTVEINNPKEIAAIAKLFK